jgi:putative ABC transport system permease protein
MNLAESARFAVRGVLANKVRSALTMTGIIIGVSSVIILIAAGGGASNAVLDSFSGLGADVLTVTPSQGGTGGRSGGAEPGSGSGSDDTDTGTQTREAELTQADADALLDRELAPDVIAVAPVVTPPGVTGTFRGASHEIATFTGTTPAYLAINGDTVQAGAVFTQADLAARRKVALLGVTVARELAGGDGTGILGATVQLSGRPFRVIGILTDEGNSGPGPPGASADQNDRVIAPLTATQDALTGYGSLSSISVRAGSSDTVAAAASQVRTILNTRHRVTPATEDYEISSSSAILETVATTTSILTLLLGGVAAISLLVGGIGVMNIMLVTVTERTREIGIRKAIGAQQADIIGQFLLEAVILSVTGGVIGVVIGVLVGQLDVAGVQLVVAPYSIYLAFGFSVAVGVVFGLYPANRAASLNPIDALRYE